MDPADIRVGDAERDQVTTALHEHFAQGRLTQAELEERLDTALSARTAGELRQVTHDLPQPHSAAGPDVAVRRRHHRHRPPVPLILIGLLVLGAFMTGPWWAMFFVVRLVVLAVVITALVKLRRRGRSARHWGGPGGPAQWGDPDSPSQWGGGPGGPWGAAQAARAQWAGQGARGWAGQGSRGWGGPGGRGFGGRPHSSRGTDRE